MAPRNQGGFTILELMIAITVLGVLLGIAVPSMKQMIRNNQLIAQTNEFVGALNFTRSEAVKRADNVSICASTDGATCSGSTNWATGYIAFHDPNANGAFDGTDTVLQSYPTMTEGFTLSATSRAFVRYTPTGMSAFTETFDITRTGCTSNNARRVTIGTTGRIATAKVNCP